MKKNKFCNTSGTGLWSNKKKKVEIISVEVTMYDLRVFFTKKNWNIKKDGLIYTDPQWIREFRYLLNSQGFSKKACLSVDYSEQGMQGNNYVSLDMNDKFLKELSNRIIK